MADGPGTPMSANLDCPYPPNAVLDFESGHVTSTRLAVAGTLAAAIVDVALFGFPDTVIPYNYPFFGDVLLLVATAGLLPVTHRVLCDVASELTTIIEYNENDPLALQTGYDPGDVHDELSNALFLAYHPGVLLAGALAGGSFVFGIMYLLGVFPAYPYLLLNFGFGAAHGVFFGPVLGGGYVLYRGYSEYIVDINLLDPDGVGGYRQIGNGIVTLASYGILFVTLDFVILSSVAFTRFTRFQLVVSVLYFLLLTAFAAGTFVTTLAIRRKLIAIRDEKIAKMQRLFNWAENSFWWKYQQRQNSLADAINILTIYAMFHQMSRMDMWPINLYSLTRLAVSVAISIAVFVVRDLELWSYVLP